MQFAIYAVSLPTPPPPYPKVRFDLVPPIASRISLRASASPPARDRVIDFGKFKGRMLGSLPSAYLKWVSSNLRAGDTEEWARLADRVLSDPVYRDRLEWEAAEKILSGSNAATSSSRGSAVSELLEISQRFGWDNEDKSGWSKVDFGLLGTSKGGRIPRAEARSLKEEEKEEERRNERNESGGVGKRGERRERVRRMREKKTSARSMGEERGTSSPAVGGAAAASPFPGREALLKKVLNREKL